MRFHLPFLAIAAALQVAVAGGVFAADVHPVGEPAGEGEVGELCIAPFRVPRVAPGDPPPIGEPSLSNTTWAPRYESRFRFYVDGSLRATVAVGDSAHLKELPLARPIQVRVMLDDRPFESFALDLAEARDHRICLWLYPGYWHWIDNGWHASLGCKCGEAPAPASATGDRTDRSPG